MSNCLWLTAVCFCWHENCRNVNTCLVSNFPLSFGVFFVRVVPWNSIVRLSLVEYCHYESLVLQLFVFAPVNLEA